MSYDRQNISSKSPYEASIGFSRAVRVGNRVWVGGTAPIGPDGKTAGVGDLAAQTRRCFEIIGEALAEAGAVTGDGGGDWRNVWAASNNKRTLLLVLPLRYLRTP